MELQFSLQETKNLMKISFTKTNGSNAKIKYFEYDFSMIKNNTKDTLNKIIFQRRKVMESSVVSKRYHTIENTIKKWVDNDSNEKFEWNLAG